MWERGDRRDLGVTKRRNTEIELNHCFRRASTNEGEKMALHIWEVWICFSKVLIRKGTTLNAETNSFLTSNNINFSCVLVTNSMCRSRETETCRKAGQSTTDSALAAPSVPSQHSTSHSSSRSNTSLIISLSHNFPFVTWPTYHANIVSILKIDSSVLTTGACDRLQLCEAQVQWCREVGLVFTISHLLE